MNLSALFLCGLLVSSAAAFGPKPLILPTTTSSANSSPLWRPPALTMAAGGAERAATDEYYEGEFAFDGLLRMMGKPCPFLRLHHACMVWMMAHSLLFASSCPFSALFLLSCLV
jgi:hypothetical protein